MAQIQLQLCRLGLHIFSAMSHCWSDSWECKWGRPQEVPEGVKYQQHTKNYRCQLAPKEPPEFPSTQDLFGASGASSSQDKIEYPRYIREPEVFCGKGHRVYLSRIPWQNGCRECKVPIRKQCFFFNYD